MSFNPDDAVYFNSHTEWELMRDFRIHRFPQKDGSVIHSFVDDDPEFPKLRVCANDSLEKGKAFRQISPPPIRDEDISIEWGPDEYPIGVMVQCLKEGSGCIFDDRGQTDEDLRRDFRAWRDRDLTRYEPWNAA
jgi:hypothetical protein